MLKTTPAASGGICRDEEERGEEKETKLVSSRIITGVECELKAVVTDSFPSTGQGAKAWSMNRVVGDELTVASIVTGEET
ncbi:unnamed protein product [Ectocarpus sp. CCAP 1310/34]|nr:unnamed protein product [Ectocarpus sp. CCAP 1310/34]